jgi:hypothetical protein
MRDIGNRRLILVCSTITFLGCALFFLIPRPSPYLPEGFTPTPISSVEDGVTTAQTVAHEWDKNSYLVSMDGMYDVQNSQWKLSYANYDFVSGDQRSYLELTVKVSGNVQTDKPVVVAEIPVWKNDGPRPVFDSRSEILKKELLMSESEALSNSWDTFGNLINKYCGPLKKMTIDYSETIYDEPLWSIEYYSKFNQYQGAFSIPAGSGLGAFHVNIPHQCLNFRDPFDIIDQSFPPSP